MSIESPPGNPVCASSKYSTNNVHFISVDCTWNAWSPWEICSVTCGGGTQERIRTENPAQYGGAACIKDSTETKVCSTNTCPGKNAGVTKMRKRDVVTFLVQVISIHM